MLYKFLITLIDNMILMILLNTKIQKSLNFVSLNSIESENY